MHHLIVNPAAGGGRTLRLCAQAEAELKKRNLPYRKILTERPGHATEIARSIAGAEADARFVAMGGDGTFNEVANGLTGTDAVLYFVSCGTGNDFAKALGLPKDPIAALGVQLDNGVRYIDAGIINERLFLNVSGSGFDIEVLRQTRRFSARFKGLTAYILGLLAAIRHFHPLSATITVDGRTFSQEVTIFEVANGRYIGGGMLVAPNADTSDGLFDVIYVDAVSKLQILRLLPLFVNGKYLKLPFVHSLRAKEVVVESPGMTINLDGELVDMGHAHYRILPGGLRVGCP